jgi:phenylacetate-CoA ligase
MRFRQALTALTFRSPETRHAHLEAIRQAAPEHQRRLRWSRDEIEGWQTTALHRLLRHAAGRSRFYRERLEGVDLDRVTPAELDTLPSTTKHDLMERWDDVVTAPGLRRADVESFLAGQTSFDYLEGRYQVFESGGSSGIRGVYVWDWDFFVTTANLAFRYEIRDSRSHVLSTRRLLRGVVTSGVFPHAATPLFSVDIDPPMETAVFPVARPLTDTVEEMNRLQPTHLIGYSSVMGDLAAEAIDGRLEIAPLRVATNSEPLLPETRALIERAWGVPVNNAWGSTEIGMHAAACDADTGLHLHEDAVILERVDETGRPVDENAPAAKVMLTSLANHTFPFIRYELDDVVNFATRPCPCGSAFRLLAEIQGRGLDAFRYGRVAVVPVVFGRPLASDRRVVEYQVRQTAAGAEIDVVGEERIDCERIARAIEGNLAAAGVMEPAVRVTQVTALQRHPVTGKLKRFVPLPPS